MCLDIDDFSLLDDFLAVERILTLKHCCKDLVDRLDLRGAQWAPRRSVEICCVYYAVAPAKVASCGSREVDE
jgi:hypothetical protein